MLVLALAAAPAHARAVSGVKMPDAISLHGQQLVLDQMDIKRRLIFDVYVWGLYLEGRAATTEEALAFQGPKQLRMRFKRDVNQEQLASAFRDFLSRSPALRSPEMRQKTELLVGSLRAVRKGDSLIISYLPGEGLRVSGEGSEGALLPDKAFADALFGAWLTSNPIPRRD
jgi:hypothetical protein